MSTACTKFVSNSLTPTLPCTIVNISVLDLDLIIIIRTGKVSISMLDTANEPTVPRV
jgi:hypothetical protein